MFSTPRGIYRSTFVHPGEWKSWWKLSHTPCWFKKRTLIVYSRIPMHYGSNSIYDFMTTHFDLSNIPNIKVFITDSELAR